MSNKADRETIQSLTEDELVLTDYIRQAKNNGMPNHQITLELTNNGWSIDSIAAAFQKEYLLRSNKGIVNTGDYTKNKKSNANPAWFLLGFPGIPMMLLIFSSVLGVSYQGVFRIGIVTTIASPFITALFWNSNRPLAVGVLLGGGISLCLWAFWFIMFIRFCC